MKGRRAKLLPAQLPPSVHDDARWKDLEVGQLVSVEEPGWLPYQAIVDVLTYERDVIWVVSTEGSGRRAFHYTDDVHLDLPEPVKTNSGIASRRRVSFP